MNESIVCIAYLVAVITLFFLVKFILGIVFSGSAHSGKFSNIENKGLMELFGGRVTDAQITDFWQKDVSELPSYLSTPIINATCYLAVFDKSSVCNRPQMDDDIWNRARDMGSTFDRLTNYGLAWEHYQRQGAIAVWSLLLVGVYRIGIRILPDSPAVNFEKADGFVGSTDGERVLNCPSGEIIVTQPDDLGKPGLSITAKIPPGQYRIGLISHYDVESQHQQLSKLEDYREGPLPDWDILFQKI